MRSIPGALVIAIASLAMPAVASLHPRTQTSQVPTVFKTGTDLVQMEISVLDGQRRPVRGLTAADFTLLEDGHPREIQAFSEITLPTTAGGTAAPWVRFVERDVASNQIAEDGGRLVIILLDRSIPPGQAMLAARRIAARIVDELGPRDLGAVVSSGFGAVQNLTADRARLLRTIQASNQNVVISAEAQEIMQLNPLNAGSCLCGVCVLETVASVADAVREAPGRRKLLFFIGTDMQLYSAGAAPAADVDCTTRLRDARTAMFTAVDRANLTVHSLDPTGLVNVGPISQASSFLRDVRRDAVIGRAPGDNLQRQNSLQVLPDRTGGRLVANHNAPEEQIGRIFRESDTYYLLGFRPADGGSTKPFRTIAVTSSRRGLDIRARRSYEGRADPPSSSALERAMNGVLPDGRLPLDAHAATFAKAGTGKATVAFSIGIRMSALATTPRGSVTLDVHANAYNPRGHEIASSIQKVEVPQETPAGTPYSTVEVLSKLELAPGEYEVRLGVSSDGGSGAAGSVFTHVSVPNFDAAPLALSSIVLEAMPGTFSIPKSLLAMDVPVVPTSRREFAPGTRLVGFLGVYQGPTRDEPLAPVQMRSVVTDSRGREIGEALRTIEALRFQQGRTADHSFGLPLDSLEPGEYLLTIEASTAGRTVARAVRFRIRPGG